MTRLKEKDPTICCLQEAYFRFNETHRLKVKKWKLIFHLNGNQMRESVAILNMRQNRL